MPNTVGCVISFAGVFPMKQHKQKKWDTKEPETKGRKCRAWVQAGRRKGGQEDFLEP